MPERENSAAPHIDHVSNEHEVRVAKVQALKDAGLSAWPAYKPVTATTAEVREKGAALGGQESTEQFAIAGRLMSKREHGKTLFANLKDRSGTIQVYLKQDLIGQEAFDLLTHRIDIGDIVWIKGPVFTTKMGELTLKAAEITLLSKCLHPLPDKFHGMTDVEHRYRQRYLDLMTNEESREKFIKRSHILRAVREFLTSKDFLEVETPMLHPIAGGAAARPFVTHHNAYNMELFLRIAPELYLKRLVVGGIERVFEINRNFRNEGVSTRHNPEFTMLEFYMAHGDYRDGIRMTEELFATVIKALGGETKLQFNDKELDFTAPFARYTVTEALEKIGGFTTAQISEQGIDATLQANEAKLPRSNATHGEKLFALFEECVEGKIVNPTFIIGYPIDVSPLAKRDPENPDLAARFELFVAGMELANGFTELNDPFDQADRFHKQVEAKVSGDHEAHNFDQDFIHALEYGLPPTVGVGIGIDRLVMLLTNTSAIKDVILFPTLKKLNS